MAYRKPNRPVFIELPARHLHADHLEYKFILDQRRQQTVPVVLPIVTEQLTAATASITDPTLRMKAAVSIVMAGLKVGV